MLMVFVPLAGDLILDSVGFGTGLALNETLGLVVSPFGTLKLTVTARRLFIDLDTGVAFALCRVEERRRVPERHRAERAEVPSWRRRCCRRLGRPISRARPPSR